MSLHAQKPQTLFVNFACRSFAVSVVQSPLSGTHFPTILEIPLSIRRYFKGDFNGDDFLDLRHKNLLLNVKMN